MNIPTVATPEEMQRIAGLNEQISMFEEMRDNLIRAVDGRKDFPVRDRRIAISSIQAEFGEKIDELRRERSTVVPLDAAEYKKSIVSKIAAKLAFDGLGELADAVNKLLPEDSTAA